MEILGEPKLFEHIEPFVKRFLGYSYNNDFYAVACFHLLLGQYLAKSKVFMTKISPKTGQAQELDPRISLFYIQDSRSGKDAPIPFVHAVAEAIGLNMVSISDWSTAALMGSFEYDGETKDYVPAPGILGETGEDRCDILFIPEGSRLLDKGGATYKEGTTQLLQETLDPIPRREGDPKNPIRKRLKHGTIELYPTASLLVSSFMPNDIQETVLRAGILQRCLTYVREVSNELRQQNAKVDLECLRKAQTGGTAILSNSKTKAPKEVLSIFTKIKPGTNLTFDEFGLRAVERFIDTLKLNLDQVTGQKRRVLNEFWAGGQNTVIILAWHHALMVGNKKIKWRDVRYGAEIVRHALKSMDVLCDKILSKESRDSHKEDYRYALIALASIKQRGELPMVTVVRDELAILMEIGKINARARLDELCDAKKLKIEKHSAGKNVWIVKRV